MSLKLKDLLKEIQTQPLTLDGDKFEINDSIYNIEIGSSDEFENFLFDISSGMDERDELERLEIDNHVNLDVNAFYTVYFQKDYHKYAQRGQDYKSLTKLSPVGVSQAIKVLSTVGHYVINKFKGQQSYVLHFSADLDEPSRIKLYNRLVKVLENRLSLQLFICNTSSDRHYFLYTS